MASIFSMTGYGKVETAFNNHTIVIELRSVNNRYLDITTKIPKNLSHIENDLRNQIKNKVARGSVFLSILMDSGETGNIPTSYNEAAVKAFIDIANDIKDKFNIEGNVHLEHLLSLPDLIQYSDSSQDQEELEKHIALNLDLAIDQMIEMRKKEGKNLVTDLKARISTIENILNEIERLEPTRICDWKEKFEERLKGLLQNLELDPIRLIQEASIVADRLDITEEIIRFRSHNQLFLNTLKTGGSQGKKLGFILQEMGREANTLGTKCQCAQIAACAIQLKDAVETIREQVMNIE